MMITDFGLKGETKKIADLENGLQIQRFDDGRMDVDYLLRNSDGDVLARCEVALDGLHVAVARLAFESLTWMTAKEGFESEAWELLAWLIDHRGLQVMSFDSFGDNIQDAWWPKTVASKHDDVGF